MIQFEMPQLGETVLEATVTRWLKRQGERVQADEALVEVSTDKVDSEIPAPGSGTLTRILVQEGETVLVGAVMAEIDGGPEDPAPLPGGEPASAPRSQEVQASQVAPVLSEQIDPPPLPSPAPTSSAATSAAQSSGDGRSLKAVLSPLVRRLAAEHNLDLASVAGTGAGGRITKQDVLAASQARKSATSEAPPESGSTPAAPASPGAGELMQARAPTGDGSESVIQVSPMRRAIAEHMVASSQETARAWNTIEVDFSRVARIKALAGPSFERQEGYPLTWTPFVSKALIQTLLRFPQLNSTWNGDGTITQKRHVDLGIAVALENGLIVPVIKGAEAMNLMGLARAVRDLAARARSRRLTPDDVAGGTFTLTNPGGFGSILSVPIINRGQAAILAFDAVVKRPVVVSSESGEDSIGIRPMSYLSVSWDHRIIDGAEAARFLSHLKDLLEEADFASDLGGLLPV